MSMEQAVDRLAASIEKLAEAITTGRSSDPYADLGKRELREVHSDADLGVQAAPKDEEPELKIEIVDDDDGTEDGETESTGTGGLVAELSKTRKLAKTVTVEGGTAKVGDSVRLQDGSDASVVGCFRGIAVVELEDGSQKQVSGKELTLDEQGGGEAEPKKAAQKEDETPRTSLADLHKAAVAVSKKHGADRVGEIFGELGVSGVKELDAKGMAKALAMFHAAVEEAEAA